MNIEKNRDMLHKVKDYAEAIAAMLAIILPMVCFAFNKMSRQLSYGYFSYYGLEQLSLKDSPVNNSNYWFILSLLFFFVFVIIFSVLIKTINKENIISKTIISILIFSFLLVNIVIVVVMYFDLNDYSSYYIALIIISIVQFISTFLKKRRILKIIFLLVELVLIAVFCKWRVLIVYLLLVAFFAILLIFFATFINIKPKIANVNDVNSTIKQEVNTDSKLLTTDKINKKFTNCSPELICKFIVSVVLVVLIVIIGLSNYMVEIGEDLAVYNTNNTIAIDGDSTYLCFYTMDNEIIGIPVIIESNNGIDQIKIISKVYRYINKESNIIYTMKKAKVISE